MFQLAGHEPVGSAQQATWSTASIRDAVQALDWTGVLRGPVTFRGTRFVAVCGETDQGAPGSGWLVGCLFPSEDPHVAMQDASLLAGYSSRAILIRGQEDTVEIKLQAALLDQGAVIMEGHRLIVLSIPGDVVPSPLQESGEWRNDRRWAEMRDAIAAAPVLAYA